MSLLPLYWALFAASSLGAQRTGGSLSGIPAQLREELPRAAEPGVAGSTATAEAGFDVPAETTQTPSADQAAALDSAGKGPGRETARPSLSAGPNVIAHGVGGAAASAESAATWQPSAPSRTGTRRFAFSSAADQLDLRQITWLGTDVGAWKITSTLGSVEIDRDRICLNHSKAGRWPLVSIDENPPNIEGNPMIVANIRGRWYGAGFDWFGEGRTCKNMHPEEYGRDQIRTAPLDASWPGPQPGELVGLLVSAPSSQRIRVRSVPERSNIVLVRWP